jgi:hypothetical protein
MNAKSFSLLAVGLFLGLIVSMLFGAGQPKAAAGGPSPNESARFMLDSYGGQISAYGCYVVDTVTGELWHSSLGATPKKVSEPLTQ